MAAICQSCGLAQSKDIGWGTEQDGSRSQEYCVKCYVNGKFTEPTITIDEMGQRLNEAMKKLGLPKRTISDETQLLSSLRRWRKKEALVST